MARIVLADIKGRDGYVNKDTIVGGFGARFRAISTGTLILKTIRQFYQSVPSITMATLASIFREAGHEVIHTDEYVPEGDVAIILSSLVDYKNERYWARKFRKKNKHGKTGFVGTCATYLPELFESAADFIISGEPEGACMELAKGGNFEGIIKSPEISDLNSLPLPDWKSYSIKSKNIIPGSYTSVLNTCIPVLASKSCPENCSYCPHRLGSYRVKTIDRVMEELKYNYRQLGSHYVIFRDSNFTQNKKRLGEFMEKLARSNLDIKFEIETRLDAITKEELNFLKKLGLKRMTFGVENVDMDILKEHGRRSISQEVQKDIISHCHIIGVQTQAFYMFGFPKDTVENGAETIRYSLELDTNMASYKVLTPFPGTKFYEEIKDDIIEKDWEKFDGLTLTFKHPTITQEDMEEIITTAYARFYFRPSQFWRYHGNNYLKYKENEWIKKADRWSERQNKDILS